MQDLCSLFWFFSNYTEQPQPYYISSYKRRLSNKPSHYKCPTSKGSFY